MHDLLWANAQRERAFHQWLSALAPRMGLLPDSVRLASADASFRRYLRVDTESQGVQHIIMDSPPELENNAAFVRIAQLMAAAGVRAPSVLAHDEANGFLLLDDLGQQTLLQALPLPEAQLQQHFMDALDCLVAWQQSSQPGTLPCYDHTVLMREMALFQDWYVARHKGVSLSTSESEGLHSVQQRIAETVTAAPQVYVHRDFMPRNLLIGNDGRLGVVDFQDAMYGPLTYDIASLMRDAFHTWESERVLDITIRYWQRVRHLAWFAHDDWASDFGAFMRAVDWMALQRHLKVLGIFARLTLRDGKPKYLADAPRFVTYVHETCTRYRELAPLLRLVDRLENLQSLGGYAFGRV